MITVDLPTLHGVYRVTSWVMGVNSKRRTPSEDPRMYLSHLQVNLDCSPAAKKSFQCIALYISIGIIDSPDTQSYVNLLKRAEADWIPLCPYEIGHWEKVSERSEFNGLSASQLRDRTMTLLSRIERMAMGHLTQHYTPWNENFTPHQDLTLLGIAFKLKTSPPASLLRIDTNRLAVDLQDNPIFNVQGIEDVQGPIRRANQILPIFRGKDWLELPTSLQNILDELSNDNEEYFIAFMLLSLNERKNDELFLIIYLSHRHASPRLQVWVESEVGCLVHAKILGRLRDSTDVAEFMLCMIALYAMHRLVKRETENEAHWCGDWLAQWNRYLYKLDDFETHYRTVQCVFASLARVLRCHINIKDPTLSLVASELTDFEEGVHFCPSFVEDSYLYKRICLGMNHRKAYDGVRKDAFISYKRLQKSSDEMEGSWVLIEQAEEQIHLDKTDPLGQDRSTRT
ncbi:MAG: hypothetical protein M1824_003760 [Vezdaea acicularis]|nr:MAG: hypothetical protein M1824_003760 [Vezdaea acicularis]